MRHQAATYRKDLKRHIVVARQLPAELEPFAAQPYSYEAWLQDELNHEPTPTLHAEAAPKTPRDHQLSDARAIVEAAHAGWRGMWIGNGVGTGKTITCIIAAKAICHLRGGNTIVVTTDRPHRLTEPMWRAAIASVGDGGFRWIVVSSDHGLKRLLGRNGQPLLNCDILISDEAHQFKNDSKRTARMRRFARLDSEPSAKTPFVMAVTATPGHNPAEYRYLSSLFAQIHGEPVKQWANLGKRLAEMGLPLESSFGTWSWDTRAKNDPTLREQATAKVRDWMRNANPPVMLNREAPWGQPVLEGAPVELTPEQRALYMMEWGDFQKEMHLAKRGRHQARGLAALTRFRQKASALRIDSTVERVVADVEDGYQVLVAVEHVTTAAEPLAAALAEKGYEVAHLYGGRPDMEQQRLAFQRGQVKIAIFNTSSSISLHANEPLADGTFATSAPRRGWFHQARYSGILSLQSMGRAHRDGQHCEWGLLYAIGTIEEKAAERMVERLDTIATSVDSNRENLAGIAKLFGCEWLPLSKAFEAE